MWSNMRPIVLRSCSIPVVKGKELDGKADLVIEIFGTHDIRMKSV